MADAKIRKEIALLNRRTAPIMIEHFDAWTVLGIRVGCGTAIAVAAGAPDLSERMEDEILAMARDIVKRRKARNGKT